MQRPGSVMLLLRFDPFLINKDLFIFGKKPILTTDPVLPQILCLLIGHGKP